jgi:outer membrane lipoprotein SlyB
MPQPEYDSEIVGIFPSTEQLDAAISELCSSGWDRAELSLIGQQAHLSPTRNETGSEKAADDPGTPRGAVVSESDARQERTLVSEMVGVVAGFIASGAVIATGGTALAAIVGAAAAGGSGAVAGNFLGRIFNHKNAASLEQQIDRGGIVLWALLRSSDQAQNARGILQRHGATDIQFLDRKERKERTG